MSCSVWDPVCQAGAVVGTARDAVGAVQTAGRVVGGGLDLAGGAWGAFERVTDPIGGPLMGLAGLWILLGLWLLWRLFGAGKQAAPAVIKGYTGVDVREIRQPRRAGERVGERLRGRIERVKGPATQAHLGQGAAEIIDRQDDRQSRPVRVVICSADPGAALDALGARMTGHTWQHAGSKRCPLDRNRKHFTLNRKGSNR